MLKTKTKNRYEYEQLERNLKVFTLASLSNERTGAYETFIQ